jgi:hypothetical protein
VWGAWALAAVAVAGLPPVALPASPQAAPAGRVCLVGDSRLDEISGMVRTADGYAVVDDSSSLPSHWRIFFLDDRCAVRRAVRYPSPPRDTEDLARAPDGTLWVADTGDNNRSRQTVALWRLAPGATAPVLYRLRYPDRAHDAEALLIAGDGTPVIVTKDPGTALLYRPAAAVRPGATVALRQVGEFALPRSDTGNPFSLLGHLVVTGAANAPDGSRVVLRSYSDAFEFRVSGGDVVRAVTTGTPRVVALPDEPQGESIAYDRDGASLLTVSEQVGAAKPAILRYPRPPPDPGPSPPVTRAAGGAAGPGAGHGIGMSTVVGAGALAAAGLAVLVAMGVRAARRRA